MVVVVAVAVAVVVSSIRCGFKIVQRQVNETIIIIFVVISFFFMMLKMLLLPMMMIHEVHVVVVVVILQIIIRTGFSVIHITDSSSIVGVGVDDFYHSIYYIHEAKSRPDFLSFEVCMLWGSVVCRVVVVALLPSAAPMVRVSGVCMEEGGSFVILKLKVISALVLY